MSTSQERINRRAQVEQMPRWSFRCEHDWVTGPDNYAVGLLWDRKLDAEPGELVYRRSLIMRFKFRIWFERR